MLNSDLYNYYQIKKSVPHLNMGPNDLVECEYDFVFNQCITYDEHELPNLFAKFAEIVCLVVFLGAHIALIGALLSGIYQNMVEIRRCSKYDIEDLENEDEILYECKYVDELEDLLYKHDPECCFHSDDEEDEDDCSNGENWECDHNNNNSENEIDSESDDKECTCALLSDDAKKDLSTKILTETTPDGDVLMYYNYDADNAERSSFHYYSNNKNIPFKYLDAVARKYVCTYNCIELYRYLKDEIEREVDKMKADRERELKLKEDNANADKAKPATVDVFATFKNYKKTSNSSQEIKRSLLVAKNRYTRLGTIDEYNHKLAVPSVEEKKQEIKNISFAEFKKMMQS